MVLSCVVNPYANVQVIPGNEQAAGWFEKSIKSQIWERDLPWENVKTIKKENECLRWKQFAILILGTVLLPLSPVILGANYFSRFASRIKNSPYDDPQMLINKIQALVNAISWDNVECDHLKDFINRNKRLILAQTENPETAPILQETLLALSARMSKEQGFDNLKGHNFSYELMCMARGLYNKDPKPNWADLPQELVQNEILSRLMTQPTSRKIDLAGVPMVSKQLQTCTVNFLQNGFNTGLLSLRLLDCETASMAIDKIIEGKFTYGKLDDYNCNNEDFIRLITNHPDLTGLRIRLGYEFIKLKEVPFEKLTKLKSLTIEGVCYRTEFLEKLTKSLKALSSLEYLEISSTYILEDQFSDILKIPNLKTLKIIYFWPPDKARLSEKISELKKNYPKLKIITA